MKRLMLVLVMAIFLMAGWGGISHSKEAIESGGNKDKILVFPLPITGPDGLIIRFVVFGVSKVPDVVIDTVTDTIYPYVTTIHFVEGDKFYGWFNKPEEKVMSIWIDGWFISWEDVL